MKALFLTKKEVSLRRKQKFHVDFFLPFRHPVVQTQKNGCSFFVHENHISLKIRIKNDQKKRVNETLRKRAGKNREKERERGKKEWRECDRGAYDFIVKETEREGEKKDKERKKRQRNTSYNLNTTQYQYYK